MEEPLRRGGREEQAGVHRAGRLAEDHDVAGVATERGDVAPHPAEGLHLIEQPVVPSHAALVALGELGQDEEAVGTHAILDGHDDDLSPTGEPLAVVELDAERGLRGRAGHVAAAVKEDEDGPRRAVSRGRPDVEVEAVFGTDDGRGVLSDGEARLEAGGRSLDRGSDLAPARRITGGLPPQLAHRRRGEGDPHEDRHIVADPPLHGAEGRDHPAGGGRHVPMAAAVSVERKLRGGVQRDVRSDIEPARVNERVQLERLAATAAGRESGDDEEHRDASHPPSFLERFQYTPVAPVCVDGRRDAPCWPPRSRVATLWTQPSFSQ